MIIILSMPDNKQTFVILNVILLLIITKISEKNSQDTCCITVLMMEKVPLNKQTQYFEETHQLNHWLLFFTSPFIKGVITTFLSTPVLVSGLQYAQSKPTAPSCGWIEQASKT